MIEWYQIHDPNAVQFKCSYCDNYVAEKNYFNTQEDSRMSSSGMKLIFCPNCSKPTFFDYDGNQYPSEKYGNNVKNLPEEIEELYNEARLCITVNAFTSSVLACRKLLMNIAVNKGANEGLKFIEYIDYLDKKSIIPLDSKDWVDQIRNLGNEATHEISLKTKEDAREAIDFAEMLLKLVYEFPSRIKSNKKK